MSKNQPSYLSLDSAQVAEVRRFLEKGNGFFHIGSTEIPSIIPPRLRAKLDSAVVIVSGSNGADRAIAIVGHRIDKRAGEMDHHPFLTNVSTLQPRGNGVLIDHPDFPNRSMPLPDSYISAMNSSGVSNFFKDHPPFGLSSGSTAQLPDQLFQAIEIARRALSSTSAST